MTTTPTRPMARDLDPPRRNGARHQESSRAALWFALGLVYVIWGSTYLGIRVVVEDMPPLVSAGARFMLAALILGTVVALRSGPRALVVRPAELRSAAIVGVLLLLGGNGGVVLGELTVGSGLAALLVAVVPLWVILLRTASGDRPAALSWMGVALGLAGLAFLVLPTGATGQLAGSLIILAGALSWAVGSFLSQRMPMPRNPFVATTWQMLAGGAAMLLAGFARGERVAPLDSYPASAWIAWAYLVVFGSLVGYTAYAWLLQHAPLSLAATYAYVNPVVAVALGAMILAEPVTLAMVVGGAIVLAGVALVIRAERPRRLAPARVEVEAPADADVGACRP